MKMAIVGCEASGKTVFMCALADYYGRDAVNSPTRLRLTPENAAANGFERYQFRQMRGLRQWPYATPPERTIELKWTLRKEGKVMADIDLLEFGGETYRAAFRDDGEPKLNDASVTELMKYLDSADFFVVLVSIKSLLAEADSQSEDEFDRETEALWVTRGILEFIRAKRPNAGMIIGLTQADKYRNELGDAGGPRALFDAHWPTVAAAAENIPIVEVASVSKTDDNGNPAADYHTRGILPVMRAFSKHCFGDENALETGIIKPPKANSGKSISSKIKIAAAAAIIAGAVVAGILRYSGNFTKLADSAPDKPFASQIVKVPVLLTNTVEKIVERQVTNTIETVVEKIVKEPVTNTVEKIIEVKITNTIERIIEKPVEKIVEKPVEVIKEVVREVPVEKIVERVVTNVVATPITKTEVAAAKTEITAAAPSDDQVQVPPGYRIWTDYNGRKIIAKWTGVAVDESGITIVTRYDRRIDAVLWKFSAEDQAYIKAEIKRHADQGEVMMDGIWVRNPLLKQGK